MNDYSKRLDDYVEMINTALDGYLPEQGVPQQAVVDAMRYSLMSGGKRIRGVLVLEFCRLCGGDISAALPFACAIEMLHCYSLIHDDLPCMDDDDLRRGRPSCHIAFGEANALLAGDGLLTLAFETILTGCSPEKVPYERTVKSAGILAKAAGYNGMVGGQTIDLQNEGSPLSAEMLDTIHTLKTGALICAAVQMGCVVAGSDDSLIQIADSYGEKIGLSFQIVDDILDIVGSAKELGKPTGSDQSNHKTTFATLYGIEQARRMAQGMSEEAKGLLKAFPCVDTFILEFTDALTNRTH